VVDPVMVASTGASLLEDDAVAAYRELLLPIARIITPNLPEAEVLLGGRISSEGEMKEAALELAEIYGTAVLLKGGHLPGEECVDLLADAGKISRFSTPRIAVTGSHGTGCTLSAAITAQLARTIPLPKSIKISKAYLGQALSGSYEFQSATGETVHALNQGTTLRKNGT
jgi:hydroxymethylpyrimidine/phosphomethylpyrimidine kinase